MSLPALSLPERKLQGRPHPYIRVRSLKDWIVNLPRANPMKASEQIISQLETMNMSQYPLFERIALLDTLRPVVRQFILALKQYTKNADLPLSMRNREAYHLIQQILGKIAIGYKLVLSELFEIPAPKEHDELQLREAIYITLQYLSRQLVEAYLVYAPAPQGVWSELHSLYQFAEEHALQGLPVDDPFPDFSLPTHYTIELAYKRILLLTLAEPYHMAQGEADDIYYLVSAWTNVCHIWPNKSKPSEGDYAVDMSADAPPVFVTAERLPVNDQFRVIDIDEVKQRLDVHLQRLLRQSLHTIDLNEKQGMVERHQRDMLLRLSSAWHGNLIRQNVRRAADKRIQMASGLSASHYYLSGGRDFTPALDELKLKEDQIEPTMYLEAFDDALEKDRFHQNKKYSINPWWQFNTSELGSGLCCKTECNQTHVRVGEVVVYRIEDEPVVRWKVGIIRWFKSDPDNSMDMGVMNLSNSAVPVAVKALKGPGKGTDYFRGLLIPKQVSLQQTRSVLVPASVYDVHTQLAVNMKERLFYIKLTSLIRSTTEFGQFTFDVLEHEPVDANHILDS
ncbi:hypothetical protein [Kaarinaea lacus]